MTTAEDGLTAVLMAKRTKPQLVVLDVMMEGMDGLSVCEVLRAEPATQNTPVIILTAATGEMARMASLAAGATEFVSKPFSPWIFAEKLRNCSKLVPKPEGALASGQFVPDVSNAGSIRSGHKGHSGSRRWTTSTRRPFSA